MSTKKMSTADATALLADFTVFGSAFINGKKVFPRFETERHLEAAQAHGRAWAWDDAQAALASVYQSIGSEPPQAGGYDWHCGQHPLSLAIAAAELRLYGDLKSSA